MPDNSHSCDGRCNRCDHCNEANFLAGRLDAWTMASNALKNRDFGSGENAHQVDAPDILQLALFLTGDLRPS